MEAGIYKLYSNEIDMIYIGQTTNLARRKREHFEALSTGNHHNDLLNMMSKIHTFHFEVIEIPPSGLNASQIHDWLGEREFFFIENTPLSFNKIPGERLTSWYEEQFKLTDEYIPYAQRRIIYLKGKLDRLKNSFVPETKTETIKAKTKEKTTPDEYLNMAGGFLLFVFITAGWGLLLVPVIAYFLINKSESEADTIRTYTTSYRDDNEYKFVENDLLEREFDLEMVVL